MVYIVKERDNMPYSKLSTGINMFYNDYGQGEPVIFISGACSDHNTWVLQVPEFSKQYRTITVDNRGIGKTICQEKTGLYSVADMASDIASLLDMLEINKCHVIGQSLGSAIAQELAINYPQKVKSLILAVSWAKSDARIKQICHTMSLLIKNASVQEFFRYVYKLAFSTALLEKRPEFIDEFLKSSIDETNVFKEGFISHWHAVSNHDTVERLSVINAPALIIAGDADVLVPKFYSQTLKDLIKDSEYILFNSILSSHLLHIEMAPVFNEISLGFLRKIKSR